jgi:hypothetical protein
MNNVRRPLSQVHLVHLVTRANLANPEILAMPASPVILATRESPGKLVILVKNANQGTSSHETRPFRRQPRQWIPRKQAAFLAG